MKNIIVTLALSALCLPSSVSSDMFTPSHSCSKPYKPYEFRDQYEIDNFMSEVEAFKRCINDFVEEMNDAARKHQEAAEDAIDEWNSYVNHELN